MAAAVCSVAVVLRVNSLVVGYGCVKGSYDLIAVGPNYFPLLHSFRCIDTTTMAGSKSLLLQTIDRQHWNGVTLDSLGLHQTRRDEARWKDASSWWANSFPVKV